MKVSTVFKIAGWVLLGVCIAAALAFVLGVAVMALWNWLLPAVTRGAVGEITYWQAVGLFVLCHLLFKSHHENHGHAEGGHRQPKFLRDRIHGLLGKSGPEAGEAGAEGGGA
jgi:hypothetical protein